MAIDGSEAGRALVAQRRMVNGTCAFCEKPFAGTTRRKYCDQLCAVRAYWADHREELNRKRREKYEKQRQGASS